MRPFNRAHSQYYFLSSCYMPLSLLTVLVAFLLLSGCNSSHNSQTIERTLIKRSSPQLPKWISQLPSSEDYFYALGISTDAGSLRQGRQLATKNAIVEVSNYLGLKTSGSFEIKRTEFTTRILEEVSTTSSANLKRSRLTQMYYEQFRYQGNNESAQAFDVYVLLRIPMSNLQQEQDKQVQIKNKILLEAKSINQEAKKHLERGNFPLAWHKWMLAMRLIDEETTDKVAILNIYKSLLTAVEGISLSINNAPNSSLKKQTQLIVRAVFSSNDTKTPLKGLLLHLRMSNTNQAGEVKKTDQSGQVSKIVSSETNNGLQVRLMMSPYATDMQNLSPATIQKITFLNSMLENKLTLYGNSAIQYSAEKGVNQQPGSTNRNHTESANPEINALVNINTTLDNPYILLNNQQSYPVTLKIDIKATQETGIKRPPLNIAVVLDKSGSMDAYKKLEYTKKAARFLVNNLSTRDYLSIIAYSSDVEVIIPSELISSKTVIKHHIDEIEAGGMTNLSGGLFEGYLQVKKHSNKNSINRILLLSDGIANQGITTTKTLAPYIDEYNAEGIGVSALGVGLDYNDELMIMLAENGQGNYYYINNPEDIPAIFSRELTRLINLAIQNIRISVHLAEDVKLINTFGKSYTLAQKNTYEFRLGDLNFDDQGILLLTLSVPSNTQKTRQIATTEVNYNNINTQKNINKTQTISVSFTQNTNLHKRSINHQVEKYAILSNSIEELERVLESLDSGLFEQAIKKIRKTYAEIEIYARGSEDAEFLQRLELLKHFEEEALELKDAGGLHIHDKDRRKNLGYKLYLEKHSHRMINHPLHLDGD